jgi:hypothetical protein
VALLLTLTAGAGCGVDDPVASLPSDTAPAELQCTLDPELLASGAAPNAIPALTNPEIVSAHGPDLEYLAPDDRVLGVVMGGEARAYPHNILWWHEVINDEVGGRSLAVTFCPLTGSGLVFDRSTMDASGLDLGVSGLLFANNLVMFDRSTGDLYGPQMSVSGRCGGFQGVVPRLVPVVETTWERWQELHPGTGVVSSNTGHTRRYTVYPYGDYDEPDNSRLLFPMPMDVERPPKERVLGIRSGADGGVLFPRGELAGAANPAGRAVANDVVGSEAVAVFYEAEGDETMMAFRRTVQGTALEFEAVEDGFRAVGTETVFDIEGSGTGGTLDGVRLEAVSDAYVAFWFAWRAFQPRARVWTAAP